MPISRSSSAGAAGVSTWDGTPTTGGEPSSDLIGLFATTFVSGWEAEHSIRFYEIFVEKTWREGRFLLKLGQLAADDDFFVASHAETLLNASFGYLSLGREQQIGPFYPVAAPGIYASAEPVESWFAHLGAYTADPGRDESSNFGFDWTFDDGAVFLAEVGTERSPGGRPGRYALGAVGTTSTGIDFATGRRVDGGWGVYAMVDQALLLDSGGGQKLGGFLRAQVIPFEERALLHWALDGGLELLGPLRGRDQDVASVGVGFIRFSSDYVGFQRAAGTDVSKQQLSLELTYRARITGWLTLQPDVQFFIDPHLSRRDAIAIGLRAVIDL